MYTLIHEGNDVFITSIQVSVDLKLLQCATLTEYYLLQCLVAVSSSSPIDTMLRAIPTETNPVNTDSSSIGEK